MESTRGSCLVSDEQQELERKQRIQPVQLSNNLYTDECGLVFCISDLTRKQIIVIGLACLAMFAGILIVGIGIGQSIK
jgi:hypothetical protein